jgi:hypothetical protein
VEVGVLDASMNRFEISVFAGIEYAERNIRHHGLYPAMLKSRAEARDEEASTIFELS